ncbi:hypothetical protein DFH06DRAFT_1204433 [Mycena polygramma]|nr:hypothetical protein DFH06DRAFT_1204433 [Mycena polygramma]
MPQDDASSSFPMTFPINITDRRGQRRPLASLGLSMFSVGAWSGAHGAVFGPIPFAVEGAIKARPGLRIHAASAILRATAPGFGALAGSTMALLPPVESAIKSFGHKPDSLVGTSATLLLVLPYILFAQKRWLPKGYGASLWCSGVLYFGTLNLSRGPLAGNWSLGGG